MGKLWLTREPEFKFFPWKLLAFLIPAMASGAALLAAQQGKREFEVLSILMAVLGAGNGYMLAAAIGDFGRSLLATPIGASAGFLFVMAIQVQPLCAALFAIVAVFLIKNIFAEYPNSPIRCLGLAFMGLLLTVPALLHARDSLGVGVAMLFPLVMCAVTAAMPARDTVGGRIAALNAGLVASVYGMAVGVLGMVGAAIPLEIIASIWFRGGGDPLLAVAAVMGAAVGNYFCINILFQAATRAGK